MKKSERAQMVKTLRQEAIDEALVSMDRSHDLTNEVVADINKAMRTSICNELGIEYDWFDRKFRCRHGSSLHKKLIQSCDALKDSIQFDIPVLTPKEKESLQKIFDVEYKQALKREAKRMASECAVSDIKQFIEDCENAD